MPLFRRLVGDRALGYALVGRVWQSISGPITIALIVVSLSPTQQGVYYALVSIVGLQAFVELGLLNVLISYAGHESSKLLPPRGRSDVEPPEADRVRSNHAAQRIASMIAGASRWFRWMSLIYAITAILFGIWTFSSADVDVAWLGPLVALISASAVNVALAPLMAVLEGAGQREDIYKCRLLQIMSGSVAVWLCLAVGWGIWALVVSALIQTGWSAYMTRVRHGGLLRRLRSEPQKSQGASWVSDIVPAQWRMAAISLSYHLATQFLVIFVLKYRSAEDAGRLGLTLSVTSAIQIISQTWLQANFPVISAKHGARQSAEAGVLWRQLAMTSTAVLATGLLAVWAILQLLAYTEPRIAERFLAPYQVAVLAIGALANHQLSIQGMYVLAKSRTPLARAAVGGFLVTAALVWAGGAIAGIDGVIAGYTFGLAVVTLPLHTAAYLVHRHHDPKPAASKNWP